MTAKPVVRTLIRALPELIETALCVLALDEALQVVSGLTWPCEFDFYRDMAAAHAALNGRLLGGPAYADEANGYNPLVPGLTALLSGAEVRTTGSSAPG